MKAFIFDTETTGLVKSRRLPLDKQPHVIEFYGCLADLKTGEIEFEIDQLFKPPVVIESIITKITGINNEMVADAPPFAEFADKIVTALESAPANIAHNLSFDVDMIEIECERLKRKVAWPRKICTVEQTIHLKSHRMKLGDLHMHLFDERFEGAHRAKADVAALLRISVELHKRGII